MTLYFTSGNIVNMGITERREREKNERKKAILNCAKELILTHGVGQVSMEDIARKAELSKATVYLYFAGKDDLFSEICEEAAIVFLDHFKPLFEAGITGLRALKFVWRGYIELFGSSNDMLIVFLVRNFLFPGQPFISLEEENKTPHVDAILGMIKSLIDQCKEEGVFDPDLDSLMATRVLLTMFSNAVDNAARVPSQGRGMFVEEIARAFQVIIYGFAREGFDRSLLNIMSD